MARSRKALDCSGVFGPKGMYLTTSGSLEYSWMSLRSVCLKSRMINLGVSSSMGSVRVLYG